MSDPRRLHIVAAVLTRQDGRILAATRPPGRSMPGRWEFPGGKLEPGESRWAGLCRELQEELAVTVRDGRPLIRLQHDYDRGPRVDLDVWRVTAWDGTLEAREGQRFDWFQPEALTRLDFLDANTPIVAAARLPDRYLVTPNVPPGPEWTDRLLRAVGQGSTLIQLRGPVVRDPRHRSLLREMLPRLQAAGARVLVNGDADLAREIAADGVHLPWRRASGLQGRPVPRPSLFGVSCHNGEELRHAEALGADFVTLGHVRATPSHPDTAPLGQDRFLALAAATRLPVYAIGGMTIHDLPELHRHSIQGIAAIRSLWPTPD